MIIGIGGCSRSGKSTLAETLTFAYRMQNKQVLVLHLDDFVKNVNEIPLINGQTDWESPVSIDFDLLNEAIQFFKNKVEVLIIEGYHFFNFEKLVAQTSVQILIEIEKETFLERRKKENRWGTEEDWYLEHVWKTWQKNGKTFINQAKTIRLDDENVNEINNILKDIQAINDIRW
jgi:nicotinamide/nicotinate riboside kinase